MGSGRGPNWRSPTQIEADNQTMYQQQFEDSANVAIPGYGPVSIPYVTGTAPLDGSQRQQPATTGWGGPLLGDQFGSLLAGLRSQTMLGGFTGQDWLNQLPVGMSGPQQQFQFPTPSAPMMPTAGPYGQQAMHMAGLLGGPVESMPAAETGNGLLGGGRVGFRIPRGK